MQTSIMKFNNFFSKNTPSIMQSSDYIIVEDTINNSVESSVIEWILSLKAVVNTDVDHYIVRITTGECEPIPGVYTFRVLTADVITEVVSDIELSLIKLGYFMSTKYTKDTATMYVYFGN